MNKLKFENQGINTYLVYEISEADDLDTMSLGMLTNNDIPGFAAASFTQMDATKYIKYNVSAKVSASQLLSGAVNKKRLVGVLSGIVDAMLLAEEYMLDPNSILLDLDYIFADVSTCETVLVCLPVMNGEHSNPELGMFFKNIVFSTQFDQTENCDYVAQILNHLNSSQMLSLPDFKSLLETISSTFAPVKAEQPKVTPVQIRNSDTFTQGSISVKAPVQQSAPIDVPSNTKPQPAISKHENLQFGPNYPVAGKANDPEPDKVMTSQVSAEKPMTMFYLLQHYNKENAAIYKAQQEAKKAKKNGTASAVQPVQSKAAPVQADVGFAVPGVKEVSVSAYATPGQQQVTAHTQKIVQPVANTDVQSAALRQAVAPVYQQPVSANRPINFGETTVLNGGIGETTVLDAVAEVNRMDPHLIRIKNNEKIPLNKPVFRIGKEKSYVDYFVGDNTAVSRSHANIINHSGEYYVVDTNSTNHTYVNGEMIPSNVEAKLSHGTKIRFANEDFEFRLY